MVELKDGYTGVYSQVTDQKIQYFLRYIVHKTFRICTSIPFLKEAILFITLLYSILNTNFYIMKVCH
jgi:hypothetical protein